MYFRANLLNFAPRWACPTHLRLLSLVLPLLLTQELRADEPYIAPGRPDGVALLAPPPVAGSAEEAADLASARAVCLGRTPVEEARALKDESLSLFLFTPAIGPVFQRGNLPRTEALFQKVKKEIGVIIDAPKNHWKRKRPYQLDKELAIGNPESSFSYPSGHSTRGTVTSLLLAELFPDQQEAILAFGRTIGWDRVLIGKHFPTDIQAGRVLGRAIVRELHLSLAFEHDLAEAKAEIEAALKLSQSPSNGTPAKPQAAGAKAEGRMSTASRP